MKSLTGKIPIGAFLLKKKERLQRNNYLMLRLFKKIEGIKIGAALIKLGYITEDELVNAMSELYGFPVFRMNLHKVDPAVIKLLPEDLIKKYKILPFYREGNIVKVLTTDPANEIALEQLKFFSKWL